jgi:hypothetical protein
MNSQLDIPVSVEIHNISSVSDCKDYFGDKLKRLDKYLAKLEFLKNHHHENIELCVS